MYAVPLVVAAVSWILAVLIDKTCSHDVCEVTEGAFRKVYGLIVFVIIVLTWQQILGFYNYVKDVILPLAIQQNGLKQGSVKL